LISHILVVLVEVENVKARVAVSVAKLPMSIYTVEEKIRKTLLLYWPRVDFYKYKLHE
jgi:hypothetical protein